MGRQTPRPDGIRKDLSALLVNRGSEKRGVPRRRWIPSSAGSQAIPPRTWPGWLRRAISYGDFFRQAPHLNDARLLIRGTVCGVRVEEVQDPLLREMRYLDKLIDELGQGKGHGPHPAEMTPQNRKNFFDWIEKVSGLHAKGGLSAPLSHFSPVAHPTGFLLFRHAEARHGAPCRHLFLHYLGIRSLVSSLRLWRTMRSSRAMRVTPSSALEGGHQPHCHVPP